MDQEGLNCSFYNVTPTKEFAEKRLTRFKFSNGPQVLPLDVCCRSCINLHLQLNAKELYCSLKLMYEQHPLSAYMPYVPN